MALYPRRWQISLTTAVRKSYIGVICFVIWKDVDALFQHLPEGLQKMTKTSARTVCQQDEIKLQIALISCRSPNHLIGYLLL
jgi:hypothetical protein